MSRFSAFFASLLLVAGTLIATVQPVAAHSFGACNRIRVVLYNGDGQTDQLGARCGTNNNWVWSFDLENGWGDRPESATYTTTSVDACYRIRLYDGPDYFSTVILGENKDYHLEIPSTWDNRADWLGISDCG